MDPQQKIGRSDLEAVRDAFAKSVEGPEAAPFETFVPGAATSMLHVREAEANFPEADARPPDAALDDAADRSTGSDAQ